MRLHISHVFPCTPDEFMDILQEPGFDEMIAKTTGVGRTALSEERLDGCLHKRAHCVPERTLPTVVQKLIGADRLRYEQVTILDPAAKRLTWRILPDKIGSRVTVQGHMDFRPHPQGCERVVFGNVEVNVSLIGGQIEKGIIADVERTYQRTYEAVRAYILSRRAASEPG